MSIKYLIYGKKRHRRAFAGTISRRLNQTPYPGKNQLVKGCNEQKIIEMAEIIKTSERLIIWMHRSRYTQQEVARELHITRQTLAAKIRDNYWTDAELKMLKRLDVE